eukprot:136242-Pelagomonas_calceolata.AAC.1
MRGELMWIGWVSGSTLPQGTSVMMSIEVWEVQIVPTTPRRIGWIVISAPWSCLHSSLCCCCEASSWAPGL